MDIDQIATYQSLINPGSEGGDASQKSDLSSLPSTISGHSHNLLH